MSFAECFGHSANSRSPVVCTYRKLDIGLRKNVLRNYRGNKSHINLASFFVSNARVLESMRFEIEGRNVSTKWIGRQHSCSRSKSELQGVLSLTLYLLTYWPGLLTNIVPNKYTIYQPTLLTGFLTSMSNDTNGTHICFSGDPARSSHFAVCWHLLSLLKAYCNLSTNLVLYFILNGEHLRFPSTSMGFIWFFLQYAYICVKSYYCLIHSVSSRKDFLVSHEAHEKIQSCSMRSTNMSNCGICC